MVQKKLKEAKVSATGNNWPEVLAKIDLIIEALKKDLGELRRNGLYDDTQSKVVRYHAAEAIRAKAVAICNFGNLYKEAERLAKVAGDIAGTESFKDTLKTEMGQIGKIIEADKNSLVSVRISRSFSTKFAEFKPRFAEYDETKIFYKDVSQITYNAIRSNYSTTYYFTIADGNSQIDLSFSDVETYRKLVGLAYQLIIPVIIKRYTDRIFDKGDAITIGELEFSKRGFTRPKLLGGQDSVSMEGKDIHPAALFGHVILYKERDGRQKMFSQIPMTTPNAVTLPVLLQVCVDRACVLGIRPWDRTPVAVHGKRAANASTCLSCPENRPAVLWRSNSWAPINFLRAGTHTT